MPMALTTSYLRFNFPSNFLLKSFVGFQRFLDIENIDDIHRSLCDIVTDIQQTYQIQISLNLAVCFFNTVCVLFITISEYRANTDWMLWISGLLWVTYYVLRVVMVCTSAAQVSNQVNKIFLQFSFEIPSPLKSKARVQICDN